MPIYYSKSKIAMLPFLGKNSKPKFYFMDNGILGLFVDDKASALLENAVAVELYRRAKRKLYYLKGKKLDADFHLSDEDALIQVAYSIKDNLAFERETSALVKYAEDGHPNAKLAIVTYEEELNLDLDGFHIDSSRFGNFFLKVYKKILSMLKKTARSGLSIA